MGKLSCSEFGWGFFLVSLLGFFYKGILLISFNDEWNDSINPSVYAYIVLSGSFAMHGPEEGLAGINLFSYPCLQLICDKYCRIVTGRFE